MCIHICTYIASYFSLLHHNCSILQKYLKLTFQLRSLSQLKNGMTAPTLQLILDQWKLFCKNPPKGFEKYFEAGKKVLKQSSEGAAAPKKDAPSSSTSSQSKSSSGSESNTSPQTPPLSGPKLYDGSFFSRFMGGGSTGKR